MTESLITGIVLGFIAGYSCNAWLMYQRWGRR